MIRAFGLVILLVALGAIPARAQTPAEDPVYAAHVANARELYTRGDLVHAREELLAAYAIDPAADLLFGLGQVEFNLKHYAKAIDYYEQFMTTNPDGEREALAQQAIGAARIELRRPPPPPPPPPPHREWDGVDTTLVAGGGLLGAGGAALLYDAHHLSLDHTGTLHQYDGRIHHAQIARWTAVGGFAAGAAAISVAILRWRLHLVDTTIELHPTDGGVAISWEHPL
ncbi:MAG: tetratricopeptide repeat protein [Kofleriaceae bacterium]